MSAQQLLGVSSIRHPLRHWQVGQDPKIQALRGAAVAGSLALMDRLAFLVVLLLRSQPYYPLQASRRTMVLEKPAAAQAPLFLRLQRLVKRAAQIFPVGLIMLI